MGDLPAVQVTIRDYSVWRAAVLALTVGVVAVVCAWGVQSSRAQNETTSWLAFSLGVAAVGLGALLWRVCPATLRYDRSTWYLGSADGQSGEPIAGNLEISLDLGVWMLLRFIPAAKTPGARPRWLPVQSGASDIQWHALRCAIYASRRSARDAAARDAEVE